MNGEYNKFELSVKKNFNFWNVRAKNYPIGKKLNENGLKTKN